MLPSASVPIPEIDVSTSPVTRPSLVYVLLFSLSWFALGHGGRPRWVSPRGRPLRQPRCRRFSNRPNRHLSTGIVLIAPVSPAACMCHANRSNQQPPTPSIVRRASYLARQRATQGKQTTRGIGSVCIWTRETLRSYPTRPEWRGDVQIRSILKTRSSRALTPPPSLGTSRRTQCTPCFYLEVYCP